MDNGFVAQAMDLYQRGVIDASSLRSYSAWADTFRYASCWRCGEPVTMFQHEYPPACKEHWSKYPSTWQTEVV